MIRVSSSNVHSIGFDGIKNQLYVTFLNGGRYVYFNVDENVFNKFLNASSKGQFLNYYIKGIYRYSKL